MAPLPAGRQLALCRRARPASVRAIALVLLGVSMLACHFGKPFVQPRTPSSPSRRSQRFVEESSAGVISPEELLTSLDFALSRNCSDEEVEKVAKQLAEDYETKLSKIWEAGGLKETAYMGQREFAGCAKAAGVEGELPALQAAFSIVANGAGYAEKYKFEDELKGWRSSSDFSPAAFQSSFLRARLWVAFGYAWLYGMSTFCGLFFFGRPLLYSFLNIDIFPSIRQWWIAPGGA